MFEYELSMYFEVVLLFDFGISFSFIKFDNVLLIWSVMVVILELVVSQITGPYICSKSIEFLFKII